MRTAGLHRTLRGVILGTLLSTAAEAHGFGQRYDLPIPLSFYVFGAGATVLLSFVLATAFLRHAKPPRILPLSLLTRPTSRRA